MLQVMSHDRLFPQNWPLFVPMWFGSAMGLLGSLYIAWNTCNNNPVLMTRERRLFLRAQGIEEGHTFVDHESLPLMKQLFFWKLSVVLSLLLIVVAQGLYYLWFVGRLPLADAVAPLHVLFFCYLVYMYLVKAFEVKSCILLTVAFLQWVRIVICTGCLGVMNSLCSGIVCGARRRSAAACPVAVFSKPCDSPANASSLALDQYLETISQQATATEKPPVLVFVELHYVDLSLRSGDVFFDCVRFLSVADFLDCILHLLDCRLAGFCSLYACGVFSRGAGARRVSRVSLSESAVQNRHWLGTIYTRESSRCVVDWLCAFGASDCL
jgi:hypothetical protein